MTQPPDDPFPKAAPVVRHLRKLVSEYVGSQSEQRPLSLALFGKTSAAISSFVWEFFGTGDSRTPSLDICDCDIDAIREPEELVDHLRILASHAQGGSVPLGLFQNIDSKQGRWLQYFLAPMHDGCFSEKLSTHKFPRCIFAFGTRSALSFDAFRRMTSDSQWTIAKTPDFLSRLRGVVDRVSPRLLGPRLSQSDHIAIAVKAMSEVLARAVAIDPDALDRIEWRQLEQLVAEVLSKIGFDVELGPGTKDGGFDLRLIDKRDKKCYLVEIKHWRSGKKVGEVIVDHFIEVIARENVERGLFFSSSGFSNNVIEASTEVSRQKVDLAGKPALVHLCRLYLKQRQGLILPGQPISKVLSTQML